MGEDESIENGGLKARSQSKTRKFKSFLNILDEHQKKISNENMNLLGLEVKKISYCSKIQRKGDRNIADFIDENMSDKLREDRFQSNTHIKRVRKTIDCDKIEDLNCNRIGFSHR